MTTVHSILDKFITYHNSSDNSLFYVLTPGDYDVAFHECVSYIEWNDGIPLDCLTDDEVDLIMSSFGDYPPLKVRDEDIIFS